jgi:hypothetical protein
VHVSFFFKKKLNASNGQVPQPSGKKHLPLYRSAGRSITLLEFNGVHHLQPLQMPGSYNGLLLLYAEGF